MPFKVQYTGVNSNRGPSPNLWADCPVLEILKEHNGLYFFDDFIHPSTVTADNTGTDRPPYEYFTNVGVTFDYLAGVTDGVLEVSGNDADNDQGFIGTQSPAFEISDTSADAHKTWFECRIKKASIADNALAYAVGLGWDHGNGVGLASKDATLVDDTGEIASFAFLGFQVVHAAGETVNWVYNQDADATITSAKAGVATMVANTYMKLGWVYDPNAPTAKRITAYVDGVEQSTYITGTNIAAATFPDAEPMGLCLLTKTGDAAESKLQMDWWRIAQLHQ